MPPSLLPPTPEELEELRLRRRASQLKGYGEGVDDPTAQALLNVRRNLGEAGRAVVGAKPYDETNPTGSYRAVQALMNAPTPAAIIPEAAQAAGKAATALSGLGALPGAAVIKPKGGNWLAGSVERALEPLRKPMPSRATDAFGNEVPNPLANSPMYTENAALNKWIDTKLTKYVKNEMATPEDPVRALAERGTLHFEPQGGAVRSHTMRTVAGMPTEPTATTPLARAWEDVSDAAVMRGQYQDMIPFAESGEEGLRKYGGEYAVKNPQAVAYAFDTGASPSDMGFPHIIDELTNAMNPNSGLPASLRLTPQQLEKVTVPQAVERVAKINEWRAAQKAEADALKARNPATFEHRAYETVPGTAEPNEKGLRWVELKASTEPVDVSSMLIQNAGKYSILEPGQKLSWKDPKTGRVLFDTPEKAAKAYTQHKHYASLEDALKYEGDVMGHCVGGYCPDVQEGRSRIYSLRDAKGEPHVTVEVRPGIIEPRMNGDVKLPDEIVQIKGKANRAPKDEYLPFVQDFVRSGQWSAVGDIRNTGLIEIDPSSDLARNIRAAGGEPPKFVTQQELTEWLNWWRLRQYGDPTNGFKKGGAVTDPNEPEVKRLPEPGLLTATMYAETAAREMYPKDPVKRDAARHMIASSILGQKLSPGTSRLLGELYEFKTSPLLHLKSAVGLGAPPPGYEMDKFNNALGSELQFRNQAELQRGVRQAVDTGRARLTPDEPAPYRRGGAVKIETNPTLMADELLFKGYRR